MGGSIGVVADLPVLHRNAVLAGRETLDRRTGAGCKEHRVAAAIEHGVDSGELGCVGGAWAGVPEVIGGDGLAVDDEVASVAGAQVGTDLGLSQHQFARSRNEAVNTGWRMLCGGARNSAGYPGDDKCQSNCGDGAGDQPLAIHTKLHGSIMVPMGVSPPSGQSPVVLVLI